MGGLGAVAFAPVVLDGRWFPGADGRHRPSGARLPRRAVRRLADRARRLLRDGQRPGPRADPRRGPLRRPRRRRARRAAPSSASRRATRRRRSSRPGWPSAPGSAPGDLTLLFAPTASLAGGGPGRRAGRRDRAAQAARARVRRAAGGERVRDLPAAAGRRATTAEAIGRTNDAVLYGGQVELTVDAPDEELEALVDAPAVVGLATTSASRSARSSRRRTGTSTRSTRCCSARPRCGSSASESGRSFRAGGVALDVLERSFRG